MNKFLNRLMWEDGYQQRAIESPIMLNGSWKSDVEYNPMRLQKQYYLQFKYAQEAWVDDGAPQNNDETLIEMRKHIIHRMQRDIFGTIEALTHEILFHLTNKDIESAKQVACLILSDIRGADE